jgi:hypothetical protein
MWIAYIHTQDIRQKSPLHVCCYDDDDDDNCVIEEVRCFITGTTKEYIILVQSVIRTTVIIYMLQVTIVFVIDEKSL